MVPILNGTVPPGMLDGGNARVGPDGIGARHIPYSIKGGLKGLLQGNYVLDHGSSQGGSCLGQLHLEGRFIF